MLISLLGMPRDCWNAAQCKQSSGYIYEDRLAALPIQLWRHIVISIHQALLLFWNIVRDFGFMMQPSTLFSLMACATVTVFANPLVAPPLPVGTIIPNLPGAPGLPISPSVPTIGTPGIPSLPNPSSLPSVDTPVLPIPPILPNTGGPGLPSLPTPINVGVPSPALPPLGIPTLPTPPLSIPSQPNATLPIPLPGSGTPTIGIPGLPSASLALIPTQGLPSLPLPPLAPNFLTAYIEPSIRLLEFVIELLQRITQTGGTSIPGVAGTPFTAGTNILQLILNTIVSLLEGGRVNIPAIPSNIPGIPANIPANIPGIPGIPGFF